MIIVYLSFVSYRQGRRQLTSSASPFGALACTGTKLCKKPQTLSTRSTAERRPQTPATRAVPRFRVYRTSACAKMAGHALTAAPGGCRTDTVVRGTHNREPSVLCARARAHESHTQSQCDERGDALQQGMPRDDSHVQVGRRRVVELRVLEIAELHGKAQLDALVLDVVLR